MANLKGRYRFVWRTYQGKIRGETMAKSKGKQTAMPSDNPLPKKYLVSDAGIVEREIYQGDIVKITTARQAAYLNGTVLWKQRDFIKGNVEELLLVLPELSIYEKAFLGSVQPYIGYQDCMLKMTTEAGERDVLFRDLLEIVNIGKTKLTEVIRSLREKDILYVGKNSRNNQYFVNPWLFNKGARINKVLAAMFQNYRIRSMGGVRWKDLNR